MLIQLRMFAATVYGRGIIGQSSNAMLEIIIQTETGELTRSHIGFK